MNPYQPPEASLDNPVALKIDRPPEVSLACRILWIVLIVGQVSLLPAIRGEWWQTPGIGEDGIKDAETVFLIGISLFVVIGTAIDGMLIWLISRRHNWARWVSLAVLIFDWYSSANELPQVFSETPLAGLIDLMIIPAEIWATYLLFFGPGARWFKATPAPASSSPQT